MMRNDSGSRLSPAELPNRFRKIDSERAGTGWLILNRIRGFDHRVDDVREDVAISMADCRRPECPSATG